jgi:hypothetical protein
MLDGEPGQRMVSFSVTVSVIASPHSVGTACRSRLLPGPSARGKHSARAAALLCAGYPDVP